MSLRGEWEENLTITSSLTLRGAGEETSIRAQDRDFPAIRVQTPEAKEIDVLLDHLTVTGAAGTHGSAVQIVENAKVTIKGCILSENLYGVTIRDAAQVRIENNVIQDNAAGGIYSSSSEQASGQGNDMRNKRILSAISQTH